MADSINETTFLVEGAEPRRQSELLNRIRQPMDVGNVFLCTTGSGGQIAYLDEALVEGLEHFLLPKRKLAMKISRIYLENVKRFGTFEIDVRNNLTGDISDQFLILGDNGAGKTTVLQAVALCLSLAGEAGEPDWLAELSNSYKRVFPGRFFKGLEPMYTTDAPAPEEYCFLLSDGNRTYDIEEMSAGDQSVFPLLFEFVRMQIRNSVVLIDEIDLNLHPPLAQALLSALPMIGPGCQFLLTTHSESVSALASP